MVSVNKQNHQSKKETNPNQPSTSSDTEDPNNNNNPNPNSNQMDSSTSSSSLPRPLVIEGSEEDAILEKSEYLNREEVIRRRLRRVKQMERLYKDHYWSLMEELRVKHREYYWEFGKSPFKEEEIKERAEKHHNNNFSNGGGGAGGLPNGGGVVEGSGENHNINGGGGGKLGVVNGGEYKDVKYRMCDFNVCKSKAMALANYCHEHIILDTRQTLYKSCSYVTKSGGSTGAICCGKTILSSNLPLLCSPHLQKAEKHVTRALRVAGLNNIISSSKLAPPKLHIIVAESVRQINAKRREKGAATNNGAIEEENNAQVS